MIDLVAAGCVVVGFLLTGGGLYRRDSCAQLLVRRAWGLSRRVLGLPAKTVKGRATLPITVELSAEGMTPPLSADPSLPLDERVAVLEANVNILSRSIQSQAKVRRERDHELREMINEVRNALATQGDDLRRLVRQARAPERMEWFGLALLFIGTVLGLT